MQVTDDTTKLKLFMDVLDGAKAAVSHHGKTHFPVILFLQISCFTSFVFLFLLLQFYFLTLLSLSADYTHVCAMSSSWIHDGHTTTHPPQTVEMVCILASNRGS